MNHARLFAVLVFCQAANVAWAADPRVLEAEQQRIELIEKMAPAVVAIFSSNGDGGGSGVLIGRDGYALTNFHVVNGSGVFLKCGLNDGLLYDAVVVGIDPTGDVAMVKLLGRDDFPTAKLGDSDQLKVGDWTYVMGNPFLLAADYRPTVTYGIVSGAHRYQYPAGTFLEYTDCIQVDTSINPGNSGGPLFNARGELVGVNGRASFEKRGRVNVGAGYAISINQIKHFMDHLRGGRIVDHATLNATVATQYDGTVAVDRILENSDAFRRGLRDGDEIVSFAGRPIRSVNQFKNILGIYPSGWKLPLVFRREGRKQEIVVRLAGLHRESEMMLEEQPRPGRGRGPHDRRPDEKKPDGGRKDNPDKGHKEDGPSPEEEPTDDASEPTLNVPEKYKNLFSHKKGFANWHFNEFEQERALRAVPALGNYSTVAGPWSLSGAIPTGGAFEFVLTDEALGLEWDGTPFFVNVDEEPTADPPGSGGLLLAMHHLRMFLTKRSDAFGELYYLGSEPLDGVGERVDVLVTSANGIECRWYFGREEGAFMGFDTQVAADADLCEVRFLGFENFQDLSFPSVLHVRHAGQDFATLRIQHAQFRGPGERLKGKSPERAKGGK